MIMKNYIEIMCLISIVSNIICFIGMFDITKNHRIFSVIGCIASLISAVILTVLYATTNNLIFIVWGFNSVLWVYNCVKSIENLEI